MKLRILLVSLAASITLTACSTDEPDRPVEREEPSATPTETPEPAPVSEVEAALTAMQVELDRHLEERKRLPLDVGSAVSSQLKGFELQEVSWDTKNYNLCLVDRKAKETAFLQSELSPEVKVVPGLTGCEEMEPTAAEELYRSVDTSTQSILEPAVRGLSFSDNFASKLEKAVRDQRFGRPEVFSTGLSDEIVTLEAANRGFERLEHRFGPLGLGYACVSINGLAKLQFVQVDEGSYLTSSLWVKPENCAGNKPRLDARAWWDSQKR